MPDTDTTEAPEERFRYLSPPEYIKQANARDSRIRHAVDLHHFVTYLQTSAGLLREMPDSKIDVLIADYLTDAEGKR